MIIIQNPTKDTYVTDIKTSSNDAITSNVGQSSTIDLFKIAEENKKTHARGLLIFTNNVQPSDGDNFTLIDSLNSLKTFEFDSDNAVLNNNILITIGANISETLLNTINTVNAVLNFDITAFKLKENMILFKQNSSGNQGEKQITTNGNNLSKKDFVRFEHSAALLNFDLGSLKSEYVVNRSTSVFSDTPKFKAFLKLIDVGKSSTRPKDFSLKLSVLNNDFKEGLGKDVIQFSDLDDANFINLDSKNNVNWTNQGIVSNEDLHIDDSKFTFSDFEFKTGKEDLEIEITDYVHEFFKGTQANPTVSKESFVVYFPVEKLFDNNTYFVKRFGSRNLKNKSFIPQLILKINDDEIENIITNKKRFVDNEENFYLFNVKGNKTSAFIAGKNIKVKFNFIGDGDTNIFSNVSAILGETIYNYKGEEIVGIKRFTVPDNIISQISTDSKFLKELKDLGYVNIKLEYFYENIVKDVDVNLDGDFDDEEDTFSTSKIKDDTIKFYLPESDYNEIAFSNRNIRVAIDLLQKKIYANNAVVSLKISFIDINKQYKSVNTRTELFSEDIGPVNYEMYDVDTGVKYFKESGDYTKMRFNGKHYILNLFCSENFKNKRVNFKFKYTDPLTGLRKIVSNDNTILRFV